MSESSRRIVIAGGSGFIGHSLALRLQEAGYDCVILTRSKKQPNEIRTHVWDAETLGAWAGLLDGALAVINLAGEPVINHWTEEQRRKILESRIRSTSVIGKAIRQARVPPRVWVNASAVGYYGDRGEEILDERSAAGEGFLPEVCLAWEKAQLECETPETRKAQIRIGSVLGKGGGAFQELENVTRKFLGGAQGSGQQWFPWIHLTDLHRLIQWLVETEREGPFNGSSPNPARNSEVMAEMRRAFHRPWSPPVPAFMLRAVVTLMGKQADPLLDSMRVIPQAALDNGFEFQFPNLREAIENLALPAESASPEPDSGSEGREG